MQILPVYLIPRLLWVRYGHAQRVWVHSNTKPTQLHTVSVNTVPFYSPRAVLLIATLIVICHIPLGIYHWKFTSGWRMQCCHLECYPWPSPPPRLKIAARAGNNSASLSPSVWKALSQWAVVHRPKCVCLLSIKSQGCKLIPEKLRIMVHIQIVVSQLGCEHQQWNPDGRCDLM